MASDRINKELNDMSRNPVNNLYVVVKEEDIFALTGIISGPENSPYQGGVFFISIDLTMNYPFEPPHIKFLTKVFHPNICIHGKISMKIISNYWNPLFTIRRVLQEIMGLLETPHCWLPTPGCPRHHEAGQLYNEDRAQFEAIARELTISYAV